MGAEFGWPAVRGPVLVTEIFVISAACAGATTRGLNEEMILTANANANSGANGLNKTFN